MRLGLEAGRHTLELAVELGIRGVPVEAEQLVEQGVEPTLAPLHERGLQVCQIGAFGYNPLSTDRAAQARQSELLREAIPLAPRTGCPYIVIGPGNRHPSGFGADDVRNHTPAALDELARALAPMLELAERHGVYLSVEPYLKGALDGVRSFLALAERVGSANLRVNIDPTSLYVYADLLDPRAKVEEVCAGLAGHYGLVHVKEVALSEGFHIHAGLVPLGSGPTDWSQVLALVAPHLSEDSWVILEHVQTPTEGRSSHRLLLEMAARAGVSLE